MTSDHPSHGFNTVHIGYKAGGGARKNRILGFLPKHRSLTEEQEGDGPLDQRAIVKRNRKDTH